MLEVVKQHGDTLLLGVFDVCVVLHWSLSFFTEFRKLWVVAFKILAFFDDQELYHRYQLLSIRGEQFIRVVKCGKSW